MKKLLLTIIAVLAITANGWAAYENFATGWTETDPSGHLSQTATRSTFTTLSVNENAQLLKNAGVSFTGNWDIAFDFYVNSSSTNISPNTNVDLPGLLGLHDATDTYAQGISVHDYDGSKVHIELEAYEGVGYTSDYDEDHATLNVNTIYYARFKRNESVGTNGTLYLDVYASDANRQTETSPLVQLVVTITVMNKKDMTIARCQRTYDFDDTTATTGYIENLDLAYVPSGVIGTNPVANLMITGNAMITWNMANQ